MPPFRPIPRSVPKRRLELKPLGKTLDGLTRKAFTKFGFADDHVLKRWSEIVGPQMARLTSPERLSRPVKGTGKGTHSGSVLTVRVAGAAALEMQHMAPQLVDKINSFYGRPVVGRLKLVQGPLPDKPKSRSHPKRTTPLPAVDTARYRIDDPELAGALARFEAAIMAKSD